MAKINGGGVRAQAGTAQRRDASFLESNDTLDKRRGVLRLVLVFLHREIRYQHSERIFVDHATDVARVPARINRDRCCLARPVGATTGRETDWRRAKTSPRPSPAIHAPTGTPRARLVVRI